MLQYIAEENDRYSIAEQVQMAIEGGCGWVQLCLPGYSDEQIRELAAEIVPLCKESSTILTIVDHIELARELQIHGVLIVNNITKPLEVRELFGPEAIIGVEVGMAAAVLPMRNLDIDYVAFSPMPIDELRANVDAIRSAGIELAVVATGDITLDNVAAVMATGVSGVAVGRAIAMADDPVEATARFVETLASCRPGL